MGGGGLAGPRGLKAEVTQDMYPGLAPCRQVQRPLTNVRQGVGAGDT